MKNSARKVVILDNITSPYIQQAIIVLNEYTTVNESKVICDAERIVNEYLKRNGYHSIEKTKVYTNKHHNKKRYLSIISAAMILGSVALYFMINR